MRSSRRLAMLAVIAIPLIGAVTACSQISEVAGKVQVCTKALELSSFEPTAGDPEKTRAEAKEKADRLIELSNNVAEADVKGALTTVANHYTAVAQEKVGAVLSATEWVQRTAGNIEQLKKACSP